MRSELVQRADDLARELDLLVFGLEQEDREPADADAIATRRARLRRTLEVLRQRAQDLADKLGER